MEDSNVDPTKAMQQEYETARQQFDPVYYLIGFVIFLVLFMALNKDKSAKKKEEIDPRQRVFTKEELRTYDGRGPTKEIYIACSGLVFDVTNSEFY